MDMLDYIFRYVMHIDGITNTENYVLYVTEPLHARMVAKWREEIALHNTPTGPVVETFCGHPVEVVAGDEEMFWFEEHGKDYARDLSDEPFTDHVEFRCSECGVWIAEIFGGNAFDGGGFNFCPGLWQKNHKVSLSDVGSDMTKGPGTLPDPFLVWRGICTKKN